MDSVSLKGVVRQLVVNQSVQFTRYQIYKQVS